MANYDLYKNIDPSSLRSAASSLKDKFTSSQSKLTTFDSSLKDSIWKAGAKATLQEAFKKMNEDVYKDLLKNLSNASEIAGYIDIYNVARENAKTYKGYLSSVNEDTSQESINTWTNGLAREEAKMDECEAKINSLL